MYMGHDHSCLGIEGHGQRPRLGLESQLETRSVRLRSSNEHSFLVRVGGQSEADSAVVTYSGGAGGVGGSGVVVALSRRHA